MIRLPFEYSKMNDEHYQQIINLMMDLVCVVDKANRISFANDAFATQLGYNPDNLIGVSVFDIIHQDYYQIVSGAIEEAITTGYNKKEQFQVRHANGTYKWLEGIASPILDEHGNSNGFIAVNRDITERKEYEKLLKLTRKVFKYSIQGILVTDINGNIQLVNQAFENITGYSQEDCTGNRPNILKSDVHDSNFYKGLWETLITKGQWQGEIINRKKNGDLYHQWAAIATIKDENNIPISYCSVIQDITSKRMQEQKLASDLELARNLQKSILSKPIKNKEIDISGLYLPSAQLAGDMYAWYQIDDDRYGIILLDIMGHGVASSLVSMSIRSLLRGIIQYHIKPEDVLQELNSHMKCLYRENGSEYSFYFTAIYVLVNTRLKTIEYASAGHPAGILINEDHSFNYLEVGSIPIGMLPHIKIETGVVPLKGRSHIILYTDGLTESFGIHKTDNIVKLKDIALKLDKFSSSQIIDDIHEHIQGHHGQLKDDVSLVVITVE